MEALISLRNVGCTYRVRKGLLRHWYYPALRDISFNLYRGETLGLIGRNGVGKSTLLQLIARIILPDSGEVIYHRPLSISLLTLQLGFAETLSGRDNVILSTMLMGYSRAFAKSRMRQIIEFAELERWIDEPLNTYSAGMRARLGFAIALEASPDILLVDEVMGVGDESFRRKSSARMKERMGSDQTVVFVSHSPASIRQLCNRVVWIEDGMTRQEGPTHEVVAAYHAWTKTEATRIPPATRDSLQA